MSDAIIFWRENTTTTNDVVEWNELLLHTQGEQAAIDCPAGTTLRFL